MEPLEQIARDLRVIRRVVELLVVLGLVLGLYVVLDAVMEDRDGRGDAQDELCREFPNLTGC